MSDSEGNVGIAFGMVCGAGACTSLGAGMAFCVNLEVPAPSAASVLDATARTLQDDVLAIAW